MCTTLAHTNVSIKHFIITVTRTDMWYIFIADIRDRHYFIIVLDKTTDKLEEQLTLCTPKCINTHWWIISSCSNFIHKSCHLFYFVVLQGKSSEHYCHLLWSRNTSNGKNLDLFELWYELQIYLFSTYGEMSNSRHVCSPLIGSLWRDT
jgi:hypothetical protein